ncbi:MAG: four helix bundle protein, partial [Chitinophagaceae bacterium]|nr:four helix bundle protein [Chitinophagaceae bacterium]
GQSNAEFKRFLKIALRSCIEVVGCIYLAKSRTIISDDNFKAIYEKCEEVSKIISGLKNAL